MPPKRCSFRKSYPRVAMMQPRQNGRSGNVSISLDRSTQRRILVQRLVCARVIAQCRDHAHINSSDCVSVVLKKRLPGLRRHPPTPHHIFGDRRLGDLEPQHQQFAMNSGRTPQWIISAHLSDKIA